MSDKFNEMVALLKDVDADCKRSAKIDQLTTQVLRAERIAQKHPESIYLAEKAKDMRKAYVDLCQTGDWRFRRGGSALAATIMYTIRAHCRGRIHMEWYNKYEIGHAKHIKSLDNQKEWLLNQLATQESHNKGNWGVGFDNQTIADLRVLINNPPERPFVSKLENKEEAVVTA